MHTASTCVFQMAFSDLARYLMSIIIDSIIIDSIIMCEVNSVRSQGKLRIVHLKITKEEFV